MKKKRKKERKRWISSLKVTVAEPNESSLTAVIFLLFIISFRSGTLQCFVARMNSIVLVMMKVLVKSTSNKSL